MGSGNFLIKAKVREFDFIDIKEEEYLRKALLDSSYALKLKKAVRVSVGIRKCRIETSL